MSRAQYNKTDNMHGDTQHTAVASFMCCTGLNSTYSKWFLAPVTINL